MTHDELADEIQARGVTEVLHFTTHKGLVGTLDTGALLSRADLLSEGRLESIRLLNCKRRSDEPWIDFINLSISNVNKWMFDTSERWHQQDDVWWAVLAFEPEILTHDGVLFTTTNNIYPATRRAEGAEGFRAIFADEVRGRYEERWRRDENYASANPTDPQAEVLYPNRLSLDYLKAVYVPEQHRLDDVAGIVRALPPRNPITVEFNPGIFLPMTASTPSPSRY